MRFFLLKHAEKKDTFFLLRACEGFTFIEIIITLAVLTMLLTITVASFSEYATRQQYTSEVNDVTRSVTEQRSRALAALGDTEHGVHVSSTTVTVFDGVTYSAGSPTNTMTSLLYTSATSSFSDGLPYISFSKITGEPSATGTIELYSQRLQSTATITIYASGLIE